MVERQVLSCISDPFRPLDTRQAAQLRSGMRKNGPNNETRSSEVTVLAKALDLLRVLAKEERQGLSVLSKRAGMTKASAYRILNTLERRGYLAKHSIDRTYTAGPNLIALSYAFVRGSTLITRARPVLESVHEEF